MSGHRFCAVRGPRDPSVFTHVTPALTPAGSGEPRVGVSCAPPIAGQLSLLLALPADRQRHEMSLLSPQQGTVNTWCHSISAHAGPMTSALGQGCGHQGRK